MQYSSLVPLVTALLASYGPCLEPSDFEEDCAGDGLLTAGVQSFHLKANKRDVPRINPTRCFLLTGHVVHATDAVHGASPSSSGSGQVPSSLGPSVGYRLFSDA